MNEETNNTESHEEDECDYSFLVIHTKISWVTMIFEKETQIYAMSFDTEEKSNAFGIGFIKGLMAAQGLK